MAKGIHMQLRIQVVKGKPQGQFLSFPVGEFMFGRGPECDVRPNSDLVSRQHCLLQITDSDAKIRDLGSRNGTLVNGQLVNEERRLYHGDLLQIGPLVLMVLIDDVAKAPAPSFVDTSFMARAETATDQAAFPETAETTTAAKLIEPASLSEK